MLHVAGFIHSDTLIRMVLQPIEPNFQKSNYPQNIRTSIYVKFKSPTQLVFTAQNKYDLNDIQ